MTFRLREYLDEGRRSVDVALDGLLPPSDDGPARTIAEAMRYAVLGGGKRLRPILALSACSACGGDEADVLEAACSLEMIHTYSLIHDDLPAMDDDDLRRGRPTVHRAYGEAVAILAGDALHTLAFEVLGLRPAGDEYRTRRLDAVAVLARSSGVDGMVGGQIADLEAVRLKADADRLAWIHRHKTGALFAASAEIGAIHAGAQSGQRDALARYGESLGLAFQITDDVLDCTASAEALGKTPGKDARAGKATYPALFGLEASRERANDLVRRALGGLERSGLDSTPLRELARFVVDRSR